MNRHSEHPLGRVIAREAVARGLSAPAVSAFRIEPGQGAEGVIDGRVVLVGSRRLLTARGVDVSPLEPAMTAATQQGATTALVSHGGVAVGVIALADTVRETANEVVTLLRQGGVARIELLTGDGHAAAEQVANQVGVDAVSANLLPADKVDRVKALGATWGSVAMVGDGVNDAPALAAADVGIVMGAAGSDAALETADVALMGDDLARLPFALRLARATMSTIRANVVIALAMKIVFLVLAVGGYTSLWLAIVADTGTSLLVVANGLRLLRTR